MRTRLMTASLTAFTLTGTLALSAQTPQTQTPTTSDPQTQRPTTSATDTQTRGTTTSADQNVTVTGCLRAEKDVPGRQPNMAERAGIGNDFVLTNVKMSQGSATSGLGLASMYQVKGVSESELKNHMNHQVEITGKLEANTHGTSGMSGTSATAGSGTTATSGQRGTSGSTSQGSNSDLPDLDASSVRMVSATCTAQ